MNLLGGLFGGGQAPSVKQASEPTAIVTTRPENLSAQNDASRPQAQALSQAPAATVEIQPLQTSQAANFDLVKFLTDTALKLNDFRANMLDTNLSQLTSNVLDTINVTLKTLGGTLVGKLVTPAEKLATQQTPAQATPAASPQIGEADLN